MEINKTEIKQILDTLPIGYYADRPITVNISETEETSFYDLEKDEITFAYNNIAVALENVEDFDKETAIRTVLYHELSHAILTPQNMQIDDMLNIFEDERIETLLNDFYLNTDFKGMVYAETKDFIPQDEIGAFFKVVRCRQGKAEFLKRVEEIIYKYAMLGHNINCDEYWDRGTDTVNYYVKEVKKLYDDIAKDFRKNPNSYNIPNSMNNPSNATTPNEMDWIRNAQRCGYTKEEAEKMFEELKKHFDNAENTENKTADDTANDTADDTADEGEPNGNKGGLGKLIIKQAFGGETVSSLNEKLANIISIFNKKNASGSAYTSYSGIINPKLCGNNNYRFFERKAETKGNNRFGSFHLTLWIDTSGSFYDNKNATNSLIKALELIEKKNPNFSLDIVHCSCGERLMPKGQRFINPDGGNHLDKKVFELYRKLQKSNTYNYNIFLFDGNANPDYIKGRTTFNLVDFNNCMFISDYSNERYLNKMKSAQVILTTDYVGKLYENVFTALHRAFR